MKTRRTDEEKSAFTRKYNQIATRLFRFTLLLMGDDEQSERCMEKVFLKGLETVPSEWEGRDFSLAMFRTLVQVCRGEAGGEISGEFAEEEGVRNENHRFFRALGSLPMEDRVVLLLRLMEGMTEEETSFILKESAFRIRLRLERGSNALASRSLPVAAAQ